MKRVRCSHQVTGVSALRASTLNVIYGAHEKHKMRNNIKDQQQIYQKNNF